MNLVLIAWDSWWEEVDEIDSDGNPKFEMKGK
jgi:hypothetical protein